MRKLIHNNLEECLRIVLRNYGIRYGIVGVQIHHRHPLYPSFNSISYLLSRYGLDSSLVKVPIEDLRNLDSPVLVNYDGLILPIVDICNDGKIVILNEQLQRENIDIVLQSPFWDGTTLVIQRFEENDIQSPLITVKVIIKAILFNYIPICAFSAIFLYLFYARITQIALELTVLGWILLISSMMGLLICTLLQIEVYDRANKWVGRICHSHSGNKRDCLSVLDSKGASILGIISLTDVGTLVFISYLALLLIGNIQASISLIVLFSLVSLLFVPYSIFYQKRYVKKWCVLCFCVIGVLLINGISAITFVFAHSFQSIISSIFPSIKQLAIILAACYILYWIAKNIIDSMYHVCPLKIVDV